MPIEELKKLFEEKIDDCFLDSAATRAMKQYTWQLIITEVIPKITKAMLVEERGVYNSEATNAPQILSEVEGHNQCCALQRNKQKKLCQDT